jgi:hypothetical protein
MATPEQAQAAIDSIHNTEHPELVRRRQRLLIAAPCRCLTLGFFRTFCRL